VKVELTKGVELDHGNLIGSARLQVTRKATGEQRRGGSLSNVRVVPRISNGGAALNTLSQEVPCVEFCLPSRSFQPRS
jgi:hypothetical protein